MTIRPPGRTSGEQADATADDYQERVLRNEGELVGLKSLVRETREADRKLIEQRSDSLAQELERRAKALLELVTARADAVLALGQTEREADQDALKQHKEAAEATLVLLREMQDTAIRQNYEQSNIQITGVRDVLDLHINKLTLRLEHEMNLARNSATSDLDHVDERGKAALGQLAERVHEWRTTDREARELQAVETSRRLDVLNHNHDRTQVILATSVTRDLWQAGNDSQAQRENVLREQVSALDRALLGMNSIAASETAHQAINKRIDEMVGRAEGQVNAKMDAFAEKLADLKTRLDTSTGKSSGYSAFYGWAVAAVGVIVTVVVAVNSAFT
jgi:hypothetical protein